MKYIALFMLVFIGAAYAVNVGVSPPVVNLGVVKQGSSSIVRFFVLTPSADPITVMLTPSGGDMGFFTGEYFAMRSQFSEESTDNWVEFFANPIELLPTDSVGQGVRGAREVNFLLNVPGDAEPGYHMISIRPDPIAAPGGGGVASVNALTAISILFYVDGDSSRDGFIADVLYKPGMIDTYFKNSGSVTMLARSFNDVSKNGTKIGSYESGIERVEPGELHKLSAPAALELGDYQVSTRVDFETGSDSQDGVISASQAVYIAPAAVAAPFPWWIIIFVMIIIAGSVALYKRM